MKEPFFWNLKVWKLRIYWFIEPYYFFLKFVIGISLRLTETNFNLINLDKYFFKYNYK